MKDEILAILPRPSFHLCSHLTIGSQSCQKSAFFFSRDLVYNVVEGTEARNEDTQSQETIRSNFEKGSIAEGQKGNDRSHRT